MKKKINVLILFILSIAFIRLEVLAATSAVPGDTSEEKAYYNELKSYFDAGYKKTSISSSGIVTIYGKSVCTSGSCKHYYYDNETNFETALSKSVTCTNGETHIVYGDVSTGKTDFDITGTAYWSEDYPVTCTSSSSNSSSVELTDNSTSNNNNNSSSDNSSSSNNTSNSGTTGTNNDSYNSSTTVDSSETGVNTYFVVLGIVALLSYGFMLLVKKYNLFKKI